MSLSPSEENMWSTSASEKKAKPSDAEINRRYESGEQRVITEVNREKLPVFVESLKRKNYINLRPYFQRRPRWTPTQQSLLIESFLINVPVPPIVLYENDFSAYEVMDGQQRINAIDAFYNKGLKLTGLELWSELNGYTYETLPGKVKAGIDRRSISSVVIVTESADNPEEALFLKQLAFERLNTEGERLNPQEVRNCVYAGSFNNLLITLSKEPIFREAWGIPLEIDESSNITTRNILYNKMTDLELVLRFFALRHISHLQGSLKEILDGYMRKSLAFSEEDIGFLERLFKDTLNVAYNLYQNNLFKPFDVVSGEWSKRPHKAYYDVVMIGISRHLPHAEVLIQRRDKLVEQTKKLFERDHQKLLTGKGKTRADTEQRISMYEDLLKQIITE